MLFSSMVFLWIFLPLVILINFAFSLLPFHRPQHRIMAKNILLLIASLFFYAWGGISYVLIMLSSIVLNYAGGLVLHRFQDKASARKLTLIVTLILNLGILFFFKYFNMLVIAIEAFQQAGTGFGDKLANMLSMQGTGALELAKIVLPIGISFYTFQSMSYVIDVYQGKTPVQKNVVHFALYVSLFPQLIAGPIVKYSDVNRQITERRESVMLFYSGMRRFCYGLGKKVILANTFAQVADQIWARDVFTLGSPVAWLGALCYTLQIYYDFSGYSDMAIGLGRMFGFQFKENFDYPYLAQSVQEFWRRWHISLSSWFKEYVYIPLGGNRKGNLRTYFNIFIVFFLTGIRHGANFTFFIWGMYYALLQILERLFLGKLLNKNPLKLLNRLYTLLAVVLGWVFFRSDTIYQAKAYVQQMFVWTSGESSVLSYFSAKVLTMLIAGLIGCGPLQLLLRKIPARVKNRQSFFIADLIWLMLMLFACTLLLVSGTYNPFIYFQF